MGVGETEGWQRSSALTKKTVLQISNGRMFEDLSSDPQLSCKEQGILGVCVCL